MDILARLRVIFWCLIIGLWGLIAYQYIKTDLEPPPQTVLSENPFAFSGLQDNVIKKTAQPGVASLPPRGSLIKPQGGEGIKEISAPDRIPEHTREEKAPERPWAAPGRARPATPGGFSVRETRNFVVYEEAPEVSDELVGTIENLHGDMMLDLVAFSPWTREQDKVFIFYSQTPATYRRITGRPSWSGGAASLSERKIYLYKSAETFGILSHELTHVYFDSFFNSAGAESPLWLSEGVATFIQSERGYSTPRWLSENLTKLQTGGGFKLSDLMRIENLSGADEDTVRLWYAQCYSLTRFLMRLKAGDAFYTFCRGIKENKPVSRALYQAYGMPYNKLSSLEYAWRYDLNTGKLSVANQ